MRDELLAQEDHALLVLVHRRDDLPGFVRRSERRGHRVGGQARQLLFLVCLRERHLDGVFVIQLKRRHVDLLLRINRSEIGAP